LSLHSAGVSTASKAPAPMASKTIPAFSCTLTVTTRMAHGHFCMISRVASTPFFFGMIRSIKTKSGVSFKHIATASTPSLAIHATSTELVGERDGLWIASRDVVWQWQLTQTDLPVCAPLACEDEVPQCKPMRKTGAGLVDQARWQDLLAQRTVPIGPRLPSVAATGLGARSLHETWLPLTVLNGTLVVRVETHWLLCEGGSGGRVQVKRLEPPLPAMRPLFAATGDLPPELRALATGGAPQWAGLQQAVDAQGRWRIHDEWLVPLPAEVSEIAMESEYSRARTPAERLPTGLAADARGSPSLRGTELVKGASEEDEPRWGWSRLYASGERREQLRRVFVGEEAPPPAK